MSTITPSRSDIGGTTIRLTTEDKDFDRTLIDPAALTLVITDSAGTVKKTVTLADDEIKQELEGVEPVEGSYYYDYVSDTVTAKETYRARWTATIGTTPEIRDYYFELRP
jgi:hypothetical protein